jgi:hypothetical protein
VFACQKTIPEPTYLTSMVDLSGRTASSDKHIMTEYTLMLNENKILATFLKKCLNVVEKPFSFL